MNKAVLGALLTTWMLAGPARAQTLTEQISGTTFGNAGQVVISSDFSFVFEHANGTTSISIAPAADYFLVPQLSLGGQLVFEYSKHDPSSISTFALGPRVGYNIPLAPTFSLWPRAVLEYSHHTFTPGGGGSDTTNLLGLVLYAPFLFHPVPHFFIGLGPSIGGNFAGGDSSDRYVIVAVQSTIGGYFDW
jgi:hypothetical protein